MNNFFETVSTEKFNDTDFKILNYLEENPKKVASMRLKELAKILYVSDVTIIRFCKKIGLHGFNELKFQLKKLLSSFDYENFNLRKQVDQELVEFHEFLQSTDMNTVEKIVELLCGEYYVYIHGKDLSANAAKYFQIVLTTMDRRCILIDNMEFLKTVSHNMDQNTLLTIISTEKGEEYLDIVKSAKENQVTLLFIGEDDCLKLYPFIDFFLSNKNTGYSPRYLQVNAMILIQIIIEEYSKRTAIK